MFSFVIAMALEILFLHKLYDFFFALCEHNLFYPSLLSHVYIFAEESKLEVSKFSKNFLPILFNLFTAETDNSKDPVKLAVLETIKCYLQVTEPNVSQVFCIMLFFTCILVTKS